MFSTLRTSHHGLGLGAGCGRLNLERIAAQFATAAAAAASVPASASAARSRSGLLRTAREIEDILAKFALQRHISTASHEVKSVPFQPYVKFSTSAQRSSSTAAANVTAAAARATRGFQGMRGLPAGNRHNEVIATLYQAVRFGHAVDTTLKRMFSTANEAKQQESTTSGSTNGNQQQSSSSSSSSSSTGTGAPKKRVSLFGKLMRLLGITTLASGLGYFAWTYFQEYHRPQVELVVMPVIDPPEETFNHPLNECSVFYYYWFKFCRYIFLAKLFIPVVFVYYWSKFVGTPEAREAFLQDLVKRLEKAGCSFLKFGQWLSMRPDMFPPDIISALSKLRDNAPSHTFEETKQVILEQFGVPMEEIFEEFDPVPVASGSIAQVYHAKLTPKYRDLANLRNQYGEIVDEVAVKIRHPKVLEETWMDVDIIFAFVNNSQLMTVPFSRDEFLKLMQKQVDFRWEGHYLSRFAQNFKEETFDGRVKFPAVSKVLLEPGVLVESWAQGKSVAEIFTKVGQGFQAGASHQEAAGVVDFSVDARLRQQAAREREMKQHKEIELTPSGIYSYYSSLAHKFIKRQLREMHKQVIKVQRLMFGPARRRVYDDEDEEDEDALIARYTANPELYKSLLDDKGELDIALMKKKKELAFTMFDMFLKMFLRDNLIHGDLHAGNVLYSGEDNACTVLDAGMTVSLEDDVMADFGRFLHALCSGNHESLVERIQRFEVNRPPYGPGSGKGFLATNPAVKAKFSREMEDICERFFQTSKYLGVEIGKARPENVSLGDVVGQVLFAMQRHGVILRGDVAASIMAMSVCEGLIRQLDPTLDIVIKSLPYFVRYKGFASVASLNL